MVRKSDARGNDEVLRLQIFSFAVYAAWAEGAVETDVVARQAINESRFAWIGGYGSHP